MTDCVFWSILLIIGSKTVVVMSLLCEMSCSDNRQVLCDLEIQEKGKITLWDMTFSYEIL